MSRKILLNSDGSYSCSITHMKPQLTHPAKRLPNTFVVALASILLRSRFCVVGGSDLLGGRKS
eukprot:scaffold7179_cov72-Cyclotella_meneghiniana.AAC.10